MKTARTRKNMKIRKKKIAILSKNCFIKVVSIILNAVKTNYKLIASAEKEYGGVFGCFLIHRHITPKHACASYPHISLSLLFHSFIFFPSVSTFLQFPLSFSLF